VLGLGRLALWPLARGRVGVLLRMLEIGRRSELLDLAPRMHLGFLCDASESYQDV
jgi:hypothetical protein